MLEVCVYCMCVVPNLPPPQFLLGVRDFGQNVPNVQTRGHPIKTVSGADRMHSLNYNGTWRRVVETSSSGPLARVKAHTCAIDIHNHVVVVSVRSLSPCI